MFVDVTYGDFTSAFSLRCVNGFIGSPRIGRVSKSFSDGQVRHLTEVYLSLNLWTSRRIGQIPRECLIYLNKTHQEKCFVA